MFESSFVSPAADNAEIFFTAWPIEKRRAIVLIAHGAAEHAARYARVAGVLNKAGYGVAALDHRGHGRTGQAAKLGVFADEDGWNRAVGDIHQLVNRTRDYHPGEPVVLLGHSMGSIMTQQYIAEHGDSIDAAVLSGSALIDGFSDLVPLIEAEVAASGREAPSRVMAELMGGGFSTGIESPRTGFDWLSRDQQEVQAYIDDPLCGFELSAGAWLDMIKHNRVPKHAADFLSIPKELPLYVFAGECDPVNQNLGALQELLRRYATAGLRNVAWRFYAGARHELLNEINREQATMDLLRWLDAHIAPASV
ncbi:MAG: alpha/beta hydrolase [Gammaproteobacteria bacterium]|nr:alpha/beta hydrolase [Gammaproteobacteria bacterium]